MVSFTFHGVLKPGYYFHVTWTSTKIREKLNSFQYNFLQLLERRTNSFCTTGPFVWITNNWKLSRWHRRHWCFAKLQPEQCRNIQIKVHRDSRFSEMFLLFFLNTWLRSFNGMLLSVSLVYFWCVILCSKHNHTTLLSLLP